VQRRPVSGFANADDLAIGSGVDVDQTRAAGSYASTFAE
jgi:hypothetical protein